MDAQPPSKQTTVRLPTSLHLALRQRLLAEGKSMSAWMVEQAQKYLR